MKKVVRKPQKPKREDLRAKVEHLESRLAEAEETLRAIRNGEVDALAIETATGPQIFTLKGADYPYQMIIENINEGTVTLLPDGTVIYANQRFADMLGLVLERIVGSFFHSFVHESGEKDFVRLLALSLAGKQKSEFLLSTARGEYLPVAVSTNPLQIEEQLSVSMVITDLTEQKKREDRLDFEIRKRTAELEDITAELKVQNEEFRAIQQRLEEDHRALEKSAVALEELNKELESFSYSVSHDLRAPLRAIDGYARLILKKQADKFDADTLDKFNVIRSSTHLMGQLIDDLLTFSRLGRKEYLFSALRREYPRERCMERSAGERPREEDKARSGEHASVLRRQGAHQAGLDQHSVQRRKIYKIQRCRRDRCGRLRRGK